MTAEQLISQQVFDFCPCVRRSASVYLEKFLHPVKRAFVHNSRNASFHAYNVFVGVYADVLFIFQ